MTKRENVRYHPIDPPQWWLDAIGEAAKVSGLGQAEIARRAAHVRGLPSLPSVSAVSRCISGEAVSAELSDALSIVLGVPPPVYLAISRQEAIAFQRERLLYRAEQQISTSTETARSEAALRSAPPAIVKRKRRDRIND